MLKREITYEDFNGNVTSEVFYFNVSHPELIEMEVEVKGGFSDWIKAIIAEKDSKELIAQFKKLVLMAYGVKSEDGKRFIKNDELREQFSQTNAYNVLFMDLAMNDESAADFIKGVLPKDLAEKVDEAVATGDKPVVSTPSI